MQAPQTDLSIEIEKFEHQNKRIRPILVQATFAYTGFKGLFRNLASDPNPVFTIETPKFTEGQSWVVQRSFKDFCLLRQHLLEQHPDCIVPALPSFQKDKDYEDEDVLRKFGQFIIRFLESVFQAISLRFSKFLHRFVTDVLPVASFHE